MYIGFYESNASFTLYAHLFIKTEAIKYQEKNCKWSHENALKEWIKLLNTSTSLSTFQRTEHTAGDLPGWHACWQVCCPQDSLFPHIPLHAHARALQRLTWGWALPQWHGTRIVLGQGGHIPVDKEWWNQLFILLSVSIMTFEKYGILFFCHLFVVVSNLECVQVIWTNKQLQQT